MNENARIHSFNLGGGWRLALLLEILEIGIDLDKLLLVEPRGETLGLKNGNYRFGGGLRRERAHRGNRAVNAPGTCLSGGHIHGGSHATRHVGVDLNGHLRHRLHERRDELARIARRKNASHVLDGERINTHRLLLLGELHVVFHRVNR